MRGLAVILGVALGLSGCAMPIPGRGDYASAARYHEQQAQEHAYLAQRNQDAAAWQAAKGDDRGAEQSRAAAEDQASSARWQHLQAEKDSWFAW